VLPVVVVAVVITFVAGWAADRLVAARTPGIDLANSFDTFGDRGVLGELGEAAHAPRGRDDGASRLGRLEHLRRHAAAVAQRRYGDSDVARERGAVGDGGGAREHAIRGDDLIAAGAPGVGGSSGRRPQVIAGP
jgi:hypothetical protein